MFFFSLPFFLSLYTFLCSFHSLNVFSISNPSRSVSLTALHLAVSLFILFTAHTRDHDIYLEEIRNVFSSPRLSLHRKGLVILSCLGVHPTERSFATVLFLIRPSFPSLLAPPPPASLSPPTPTSPTEGSSCLTQSVDRVNHFGCACPLDPSGERGDIKVAGEYLPDDYGRKTIE